MESRINFQCFFGQLSHLLLPKGCKCRSRSGRGDARFFFCPEPFWSEVKLHKSKEITKSLSMYLPGSQYVRRIWLTAMWEMRKRKKTKKMSLQLEISHFITGYIFRCLHILIFFGVPRNMNQIRAPKQPMQSNAQIVKHWIKKSTNFNTKYIATDKRCSARIARLEALKSRLL